MLVDGNSLLKVEVNMTSEDRGTLMSKRKWVENRHANTNKVLVKHKLGPESKWKKKFKELKTRNFFYIEAPYDCCNKKI